MRKTSIKTFLAETTHRPFPYPSDNWAFYQEWREVLFLHWKVPYLVLRKLVPPALTLDCYDGEYYISLVPFSMKNVRPRYVPALSLVSDFHEINLRTYIVMGERKGVYFLNIEAEKWLSTYLSKALSGMPYEKSMIERRGSNYRSAHPEKNFSMDIEYNVSDRPVPKNELDKWLTERYCLFLTEKEQVFRFDVHHLEWEIKPVELVKYNLQYQLGNWTIKNTAPDFLHYSPGVQVLAWKRRLESSIV